MSQHGSQPIDAPGGSAKRRPSCRRAGHAEQINHVHTVGDSICRLYTSKQFSDVTLVVQGVHFPAHRVILAARSDYFRALLYGGLAESSSSVILLNGITPKSFRHLLKYVYTGRLRIRRIEVMLEVLGLAHQYRFDVLQASISKHLTHQLRTNNVWLIYDVAVMYNLDDLINACVRFLDAFVPEPLNSPHFLKLSEAAATMLLSRDSFCAPEIEIFRSLLSWLQTHRSVRVLDDNPGDDVSASRVEKGEVTRGNEAIDEEQCDRLLSSCIRFELISIRDLLGEVRSSGLVSPDRLLDAITRQVHSPGSISHRGWLLPNVNLASKRLGASLVSGQQGCYPYFFVDDEHLPGDEVWATDRLQEDELMGTARDSAEGSGDSEGYDSDEEKAEGGEDTVQENELLEGVLGGPLSREASRRLDTLSVATTYRQQHQRTSGAGGGGSDRSTATTTGGGGGAPTLTETGGPRVHSASSVAVATASRATLPRLPSQAGDGPLLQSLRMAAATNPMSPLLGLLPSQLQQGLCPQPETPGGAGGPQGQPSHRLSAAGAHGPRQRQPPSPHSEHDVVRHSIDDPDAYITVRLGRPSIINTVRMQLWDLETRSYSYGVEVSLDGVAWEAVANYHRHLCRSWQTLHFSARVVHFIRITGSLNTANRTFHLITFRCLYTDQPSKQVDGFLVPDYNVASVEHGAVVLEGVSRHRNALIDGNARMYDWNSGYTCHQLGNGAIVVQLAQPFLLCSMRFLLWDLDDRTYGYSVYVSTNWDEWRLVRDASREFRQSWQVIRFPLQLVTYIRVVGTYNSANEVFHLVHLECPYPPAELDDTIEEQPLMVDQEEPSRTVQEDVTSRPATTGEESEALVEPALPREPRLSLQSSLQSAQGHSPRGSRPAAAWTVPDETNSLESDSATGSIPTQPAPQESVEAGSTAAGNDGDDED